jgi:RNA-directed DNA polymerase
MTNLAINIGASSAASTWDNINWPRLDKFVYRLQMRIAKARRQKRYGKVKALQWLLTNSIAAKLLAVKKVTSSKGARTPGIDGKLYRASSSKLKLALSLKSKSYKAVPLKRVYILKKNGKKRPLGIPTLYDRSMQCLYLFALEPIAEMQADHNSYGFRPHRSVADAIEQAFKALSGKNHAQWILEGDIKSCFDKISHEWLLRSVCIDKKILRQWLKAGFMENQTIFATTEGTPQGGICSPVLANLALDGLEKAITQVGRTKTGRIKTRPKVHFIRYADDFIVTGSCREQLETEIKPIIADFLASRGLSLSDEKTQVTHIDNGFNFLGFNVRKYRGKLLIKPSKESIKSFLAKVREVFKTNKTATAAEIIKQLNPKIIGWANFYSTSVAKQAYSHIDNAIYLVISRWTRRRHNNKNMNWIRKKYFHRKGRDNWVFFGTEKGENDETKYVDLVNAISRETKLHVKVKMKARAYDPKYEKYFRERKQTRHVRDNKPYHYHVLSKLNLFDEKHWL